MDFGALVASTPAQPLVRVAFAIRTTVIVRLAAKMMCIGEILASIFVPPPVQMESAVRAMVTVIPVKTINSQEMHAVTHVRLPISALEVCAIKAMGIVILAQVNYFGEILAATLVPLPVRIKSARKAMDIVALARMINYGVIPALTHVPRHAQVLCALRATDTVTLAKTTSTGGMIAATHAPLLVQEAPATRAMDTAAAVFPLHTQATPVLTAAISSSVLLAATRTAPVCKINADKHETIMSNFSLR